LSWKHFPFKDGPVGSGRTSPTIACRPSGKETGQPHPASETPWTKTVWFYDFRTNIHFTLKTNRLTRGDLDEFVKCFNPANRHERTPTWSDANPEGRWRPFTYDEIIARDKASLDIFWLRDESLEDSASLPDPHILAAEIAEDLRAALEEIEDVLSDLQQRAS
jgi:type I restriction enzyme M protein